MSKIEVNQISSQCGSTLTIGQSGDTVTLACGATQTGFGRTGTVNWDTTAKTAGFTAVSGNGYFVNTTSGAITVTLPASPSAGDIVAVADYAGTAATNNITIGRNSSNINGSASDIIISLDGKSITLVYVDGTQGWKITDNADQTTEGPAFVTATGGTITTSGDYKIHTFTGPGTFCVSCAGNALGSEQVDYLVVAGGAAGGDFPGQGGGGGGAGGFRASSGTYTVGAGPAGPLVNCVSALPVSVQGYPITVGSGGSITCGRGNNGSNSIFSTITSTGGGGGGVGAPTPTISGNPGGSGGGGGGRGYPQPNVGGNGNTPPVSPPQGSNGGQGRAAPGAPSNDRGGGGGGATAAGGNAGNDPGTAGAGGAGAGLPNDFGTSGQNCGSFYYFSGGGGGGKDGGTPTGCTPGGLGGGGKGGKDCSSANSGTANTGGGGGGNGTLQPGAGNGGSGIVIIRYKYQ